MDKRKGTKGLLACALASTLLVATIGCGGSSKVTITPVWNWVVGIATETGEWIVGNAKTLEAAIDRAWTAFWGTRKISNVIVDEHNPLKGTFDGNLNCRFDWGRSGSVERNNHFELKLDHPRMVRESEGTHVWKPVPEETKWIDGIRDRAMVVD